MTTQAPDNPPPDAAADHDRDESAAGEAQTAAAVAEVDLLPTWYAAHSRRRRRFRVAAAVVVLASATLVGAVLVKHERAAASRGALASLDGRLRDTGRVLGELERERDRLSRATRRARAASRAGLPVPVSAVLAETLAGLPEGAAITLLEVRDEGRRDVGKGGAGGSHLLRFSLGGVADDESHVTNFYDRLRRLPGLAQGQTRLGGIRSARVAGRDLRAFQLGFAVDLRADGNGEATAGGDR